MVITFHSHMELSFPTRARMLVSQAVQVVNGGDDLLSDCMRQRFVSQLGDQLLPERGDGHRGPLLQPMDSLRVVPQRDLQLSAHPLVGPLGTGCQREPHAIQLHGLRPQHERHLSHELVGQPLGVIPHLHTHHSHQPCRGQSSPPHPFFSAGSPSNEITCPRRVTKPCCCFGPFPNSKRTRRSGGSSFN